MPLEAEWYIPYRVIDERVWGTLTIEETQQHSDLMVEMLKEAEIHSPGKQVYLLFDDTEAESMPPAYLLLKQALPVIRCKNRGPMFHITHSTTIRSIVELAAHVMRFKMRSFATREEALDALQKVLVEDDLRAAKKG